MSYKLKGTIKRIADTHEVSEKFRKRDFVLTTSDERYPQDILFQVTQDRCDILNNLQEDDEIEVYFNIKGREWTSPQGEVKYFNTLEAWKIDYALQAAKEKASTQKPINSENEKDDLPF